MYFLRIFRCATTKFNTTLSILFASLIMPLLLVNIANTNDTSGRWLPAEQATHADNIIALQFNPDGTLYIGLSGKVGSNILARWR